MIDLHTHSLFSDGVLLPSELIRRAEVAGYDIIGITDHADVSNYDFVLPRIISVCRQLNRSMTIRAVPGIELTHVPPGDIAGLAAEARRMGAAIIIVHGETIAEPVLPGTNRKALEADIDILAHPGLITAEEAQRAAGNNICLELTARKGHCLTNGHVARLAAANGAKLVLNSDTHGPGDFIDHAQAENIVCGAGLTRGDLQQLLENSASIVRRRCTPV